MKRIAAAALCLMLAACVAPVSRTTPVVASARVLAPSEASAEMAALRRRLEQAATGAIPRADVHWSAQPGDALQLILPMARVFAAGSAQLRADALECFDGIAQALRGSGAVVLQIVVDGDPGEAADSSLGERRAASLAAYLDELGLDGAHLRHAGSAGPETGVVMLTIRPVVAGAEAQAWMPPAPAASREPGGLK
ncbi:MAG: hypothetical protein E6R07_05405 [Nevskiaceae bacterium]|nr:MAG: hypothetical protein E6R07_05405 [Nevskiaceae bacterium]